MRRPLQSCWIIACMVVCSCGNNPHHTQETGEVSPVVTQKSLKKPAATSQDTLIITGKSVVLFSPDSSQWKQLQQMVASAVYESEVHNCFYLTRNATNVIRKYYPQVHMINTSSVRYLVFVKDNKQDKVFIDLDSKDLCGAFLFDGDKDPEYTDLMNVDTSLSFYFGK